MVRMFRFLLLLVFFLPLPAPAATCYVDVSVASSSDGTTWASAFKTIQEGIDAAAGGGHVIVAPGTYVETIQFRGTIIVLQSTDPADEDVVANTIIEGGGKGAVIRFDGTESEACTLSGFAIRNGTTDSSHYYSRGGICGGTSEIRTHATIENNIITANEGGGLCYCDGLIRGNRISLNEGGGLHHCDGTIRNNRIEGNSASYGAGLYGCQAAIFDNVISNNTSEKGGGGLAHCQGRIEGNTIRGNLSKSEGGGGLYRCDREVCSNEILNNSGYYGGGLYECDGIVQSNNICDNSASHSGAGLWECDGLIENNVIAGNIVWGGCGSEGGGGLAYCDGTVQNNVISGNAARYGGGLHNCYGVVLNNVITHNRMSYDGGALYECGGRIANCIIWGNVAGSSGTYSVSNFADCSAPVHCCIEQWDGGGEGNITEDPRFVDMDGPDDKPWTHEDNDYRLRPGSPCIDAGFNDPELPEFDIAGMHRIMFGGKSLTVDMGAYEFYANELKLFLGKNKAVLSWSSLEGKTYSIFYTDDLFNWHIAIANFPSSGSQTTSWLDDGSQTGVAPGLVTRRFYRTLENP
ncbi:MAG: right-handed parallel beta-helix repeat-containing protein [bacterium]|nr:right-handed parallel beta-helix repeat-containing protein [bacterium]